ncbi:winged helix-turn-helix domain-containing protein [Streptomyces albidoflavus]|uniref:ArsR/SmtB family transcription factor n=1 Tax=Streptomyces TaxID=1883 RepID=UPI0011639EE5|nr:MULTISPECIES: winged helix-turn-helix domain-containing protein [Streptomyces]MCK2142126.1 winged helix-turn-helix domain-containing protein [Streptomyces sp. WAC00276]QDD59559.1 winged helix-turn-helix transcriptional regulator [Streptomyces albidoflavus]UYX94785.1 winged helix-turn-helix domain-containing protein [Streptomyces sp. BI87]WTC02852.1 winged helix-turn-helix domain-containing protein [Streptomyces albidoflavus]
MVMPETGRRATSQHLHFTFDDLLKVRIGDEVLPHVETYFALRSLSAPPNAALSDWRALVRPGLGPLLGLLKQLGQWLPSPSALMGLTLGGAHETRAAQLRTGAPGEQLREALNVFWQVGLEPYWRQITAHVRRCQQELRERLAHGGVEDLLSHLPGGSSWQQPVLRLPDERGGEVRLSGHGLRLASSLFHQQRGRRVLELGHGRGQATLYLPAPLSEEDAPTLWGAAAGGERSLAALIGAGRARVLQALTEPRTTGELAQLAGISGPGASQHTAVLRKAGLITTRRERNMAWHELTPLGRAMLTNLEGGAADRRPATVSLLPVPAC